MFARWGSTNSPFGLFAFLFLHRSMGHSVRLQAPAFSSYSLGLREREPFKAFGRSGEGPYTSASGGTAVLLQFISWG